ncbi:flagellar biosynthesis protein FlhB [Gracilibacillus boraciitolerans JCM 21714]|uniref:Flagellar biosynthesis protein FlhB n=1 Tax=Gracilibacillus boraciitolerans JCM 21714 TaxID=1298598 RepID=W4VFL2_9BACI|nr:flagellar biosynthesis protein FlhB [Gracilibacillus boraciitolerans JCM 21714]
MKVRLDLQYFAGEKTEKATPPKKRQDVRKKGQVAKSQDVNTAILLFFVFIILLITGGLLKDTMTSMYSKTFTEYIHHEVTQEEIFRMLLDFLSQISIAVAPIMLIAIVAGIASNFLQIGFLFTAEPLKMKLNKIDPIQGG